MRCKTILTATLIAICLFKLIGCGQDELIDKAMLQLSNSNQTKSQSGEEFTYKNKTVKYLKHEVAENDFGEKVLIVYYDFTNNSDDNAVFDYSFDDTCFQNGVEIKHSMWHANDESKNSGKEIQKGVTVTVASSFVLGDSEDDVTLEITPFISDKKLLVKTLLLK